MKRRTLLKASLQLGLCGMVLPQTVLGAYPTRAFLAREAPDALKEVFGTTDIGESDQILIEVPHIASDANMVPVRVSSGIENTESIAIVVAENTTPFTAYFKLHEPQGFVSTRIRMSASSELLVVVKADGLLHTSTRTIRVSDKNCGA